MNSEYLEIKEIALLEQSVYDSRTGELLAKRFEKLLKRQRSEYAQLCALRRDLNRLPPGPTREAIATKIQAFTADHAHRIEKHAAKLVEESHPAGKE
mgnify:CR=1 FL=1